MTFKKALEKEIEYLDKLEIASLRAAEKRGDLLFGSTHRLVVSQIATSYKRLLKNIQQEERDI